MTPPAVTAVDLMRVLPAPFGLAVGDAVLSPAQGGSATRDELETVAARTVQSPRRHAADAAAGRLSTRRSESPGESVGRAVIVWSGFEPPELQLEFRSEGFVDRVDYSWRSVRGIAESDGYDKYLAETPDGDRAASGRREAARGPAPPPMRCASAAGTWPQPWRVKPVVNELRPHGDSTRGRAAGGAARDDAVESAVAPATRETPQYATRHRPIG